MVSTIDPRLEQQLLHLENKPDSELMEIVGAYALSESPESLRSALTVDRLIDVHKVSEAGRDFLRRIEPIVKQAICGKGGLGSLAEGVTVRDVVYVVVPALGFSTDSVIPTALVAICLIITRAGIREYCKDYA